MPAIAILLTLMLPIGQIQPTQPTDDVDVVEAARQDLAERLGIDGEVIEPHALWPVAWPDTSLGVREPGMMYAQVIVPGQIILLRVGDEVFEYHASDEGQVVYAGPYTAPPEVPASPLIDNPQEATEGRVRVEGMLVRTGEGALLYDELVDPQDLPEDTLPVLVAGMALQPFIERRWSGMESASSWVMVEGELEVRETGEPGAGWGRKGDLRVRLKAKRIQVLADRGRVPGSLSYAELARKRQEYDQMIVTVRGELTSGFEVSALSALDDGEEEWPRTWVEGDLSGLPRPAGGGAREVMKVEISGLFESRPRGAYGHMGQYGCRLTADAAYALSSILDYPGLVDKAEQLDGELVTVRGLLFLGDGLSDLTPLSLPTDSPEVPACLVTGDLSGLVQEGETGAGPGLPAQIHGRFEVAKEGEGFGRNGTRQMRIESVFARLLEPVELPEVLGHASLAVLRERIDGLGDLIIAGPDGDAQVLAQGLADFALAPAGSEWLRAEVIEADTGHLLRAVPLEGEATVLAEADSIRLPSWSPRGDSVAAIVDDEVVVYDVASGRRVATGQTLHGSSGRIAEYFWSPDGASIALNVVDPDAGEASTLNLSLETLDTTVLHPDEIVFGLLEDLQACYMGDGDEGGALVAGDCPTCGTRAEVLFRVSPEERLVAYAQHPERPAGVAGIASAGDEEGAARLYLIGTEDDGARQLIYTGAKEIRHLKWTGDGRMLSFAARRDGGWHGVLLSEGGRMIVTVPSILPAAPAIVEE